MLSYLVQRILKLLHLLNAKYGQIGWLLNYNILRYFYEFLIISQVDKKIFQGYPKKTKRKQNKPFCFWTPYTVGQP